MGNKMVDPEGRADGPSFSARYQRLETLLQGAVSDGVGLLRVGRWLRVMHDDLARTFEAQCEEAGPGHEVRRVAGALAIMEADVLHVLLDHDRMVRWEVVAALKHALDQAWVVIEALEIDSR
jgi:hypothetical protein